MKSIKKIIISSAVALLVVIVVQIIWNKLGNNSVSIFVASKDIYKGEKILKEDVKEIRVHKNSEINKYSNIKIENKIAKANIVSGKILENTDIGIEETQNNEEQSYEYVTIEVKDVSNSLAYQLKKGDYINVYYTTKNKELNSEIFNKAEKVETDLNITVRIFENIKIIGLYDTLGIEVNNGEQYKAIMLRVKKDEALILSNIKAEGTFTVSTVK